MELKKDRSNRYHIDDIEKLNPNDSHRIVLELLGESSTILDVGCSTGFLGRYLTSQGRKAVGIEFDAAAAAQASPHYESVIVGDMTSPEVLAQLENGAFDAIVLGDVIEHLLDPWGAVKNLVDKLADQGKLIVSIPHLGHASVIAALLSGTFQYQKMGLLDRTHYRFFSLESLCALLLDAGLTPKELKRVVYNAFGTEIPIATDRLPAGLFPVLDCCPESHTYQFVMKAVKCPPAEPLAAYVSQFLLPNPPLTERDIVLQSYLKEMETFRREIREARDYIAVCTKAIKEKDEGIVHLRKTLEQEQEEKERLLNSSNGLRNTLNKKAAACVAKHIETRLRDIRELLRPGASTADPLPRCDSPYDILIPVYNAFEHVRRCVESVLTHTDPIHSVYLLDDASTDARILPLLQSYAEKDSRVQVLASERNLGFVENVNRGFALSRNPVVILNSDTEVTVQWLDRLHRCLRSRQRAGIVCPLSNNATILSVPVMNESNQLPPKMTTDRFASLVARCSNHVYRQIPTAVGFCMLIARQVIDQVGGFDNAFGLGYGEENDFCERAKRQGFEILCCDDAYVYHYGEASFSAVSQINSQRAQNMNLLNQRWPQYDEEILSFCRSNPLRDVQERIYHALNLGDEDSRPAVLYVIHNFSAPGGTELHTSNIIDGLASRFRSTVIFPASQPSLWSDLSSEKPSAHLRVAKVVKENENAREFFIGFTAGLSSAVIEENFARFVRGGDYALVHFQHLGDWNSFMLPFIAKDLGIKVVLSLHDYYLLCPEYNFLLPGNNSRCGKSLADGTDFECLYCLGAKRHSRTPKNLMRLPEYLAERFATIRRIFEIADAVIAPSAFVRDKFVNVFGPILAEKCAVIRHGVETHKKSPRPQRTKKFRVGFLGNASDRKGILVFLAAAKALKKEQIQFEIFGYPPAGLEKVMNALGVMAHGSYHRSELPKLLSRIDLVVVPSVWDETFCLTVSEAQAMGVPVLASDSGAISERIREGKTGFLFPTGHAEALALRILALSADIHSLEPVIEGLAINSERTTEENAGDYAQLYSRLIGTLPLAVAESTEGRQKNVMFPGKTSIVILTFNQLDYTKECIESIRAYTPQTIEIIFVDNGSKDGTVKWLRALVKENANYKLIENGKNLGFAAGCNLGITASTGEFILLLNNDAVVTENWLAGMLKCLNHGPDIGIVGPMTNNISGPQKVPCVGYSDIEQLDAYARVFRIKNRNRRIPNRRVVGFCMLFRRELVEEIGLLDESFGSGNFEDDDFCLRAVLAGYRNMIVGDVFIHHYGSKTFIGNGIDYGSSLSGNRTIFYKKWCGEEVTQRFGRKLIIENAVAKADELFSKGDIEKATACILGALKQAPYERSLYFKIAEMLIDVKRYQDAVGILDALHQCDSDPMQPALLGYCEEALGNNEKAREYAQRAMAIDPRSPLPMNVMGVLAYIKGELDVAEGWFRKAIESDPGFGESYTNLGSLKWAAGETEEAIRLFEGGFILSPTVSDVATAYQSAVVEMKSFENAETVFREARALHPNHQRIAFLLIALLLQQEKHESAMHEIEKAMIQFGIDDGILSAGLEIRKRIGALEIDKSKRGRATLSLCMIVKDEEPHLAKCLMSVKPIVDEMIVVDTGSSDRTKSIAAALGARVFDHQWTNDFSEARNLSLLKASGDWILVLDADEVVSPMDHGLLRKITKKRPAKRVAYTMVTRNYTNNPGAGGWVANEGRYAEEEAGKGWVSSTKVRLFLNDRRIQFVNPVHELIELTLSKLGTQIKECDVPVHHYGRLDQDKLAAKGKKYYSLGLAKIEQNRGDHNALREFAIQASEIGEYEEAVKVWQKVIELQPNDAVANMNLGFAFLMLRQYDKAIKFSKTAMEIDPELREAALNYSGAEMFSGDVLIAASTLERLLERHTDYPPAMGRLAAAYIVSGRKEEGLRFIEKLISKGFDGTRVLEEQARAFMAESKFKAAVSLLISAVEKGIGNGSMNDLLAECRSKIDCPAPIGDSIDFPNSLQRQSSEQNDNSVAL